MGRNATTARLVAVIQQPTLKLLHHAGRRIDGAVLVGVSLLTIYLLLLPFLFRTWRTTGDEPHYLLAAHSLVADFDFDLANNYARFDYLDFYLSKDIAPQVRLNAAGQQILNHYPGLPVLIAPAYALGGRFGVLLFQALLAALLAGLTFKLAHLVSGNISAALLATLFVTLSPPLLLYPYLVYPELLAALLVTGVLYFTLSQKGKSAVVVTGLLLSLALLPWLNRRFVPLAVVLALLLAWRWRQNASWRGMLTKTGLAALAVTAASLGLLFWFNSQLSAPPRADIIAPPDSVAVWSRLLRGSVGWLVDQQRGLLIFAPIYILALWGLPPLLKASWQQRRLSWAVLLPFLVSWGVTTIAGGFWIAWELGPRFLVVGLPGLAPLLAVAWQRYAGSKIWVGAAAGLFAVSLANSWIILHNPELPYKSSLPLYYSQRLGIPLPAILPDLAEYARFSPAEAGSDLEPVTIAGEPAWFVPAGSKPNLVNPAPQQNLPFGHYRLSWALRTEPNLPPETELARLSIKYLGGGQLFNQPITAADLPPDGSFGSVQANFFNTNTDRWRTPMLLHVTGTGQAALWVQELWLQPQPLYAFGLPYLYLLLLGAGAMISWAKTAGNSADLPLSGSNKGRWVTGNRGWSWFLLLPIGALAYLGYAHSQPARSYDAAALSHFVGRPTSDPAAQDGQAWQVDPASDPPQKAIYGPFDFFDAGSYRVTFRLKLPEPVETGQEIARLQVNATTNFEPLVTQPILASHFNRPDLYHEMVLIINNPRRQALSFDVHYLGVAPLVIDGVTITKVED